MTDSQIRHLIWVDFNRNEGKNIEYTTQENNKTRTTTFSWVEGNENKIKIVEWDYFGPLTSLETNAQLEKNNPSSVPNRGASTKNNLKAGEPIPGAPTLNDHHALSEEIVTMSVMSDLVWGKDPEKIKYLHDNNHHECIIDSVKYISFVDKK